MLTAVRDPAPAPRCHEDDDVAAVKSTAPSVVVASWGERSLTFLLMIYYMVSNMGKMLSHKVGIDAMKDANYLALQQSIFAVVVVGVAFPRIWKELENERDVRRWVFFYSPVYYLRQITSSYALRFNSIYTTVVFRQLSPFIAMGVESFSARFSGNQLRVSSLMVGALLLIVLGVSIYSWAEIDMSLPGVICILVDIVVDNAQRLVPRYLL